MSDIVTSILSNSQIALIVILAYFVALWLMFCLWVFIDASRRYHNVFIALVMTLLVFVFNFPVLIFYLIVRPEDDYTVVNDGTVNVPVANFVGDNGEVVMSLNLKINGQPSHDSNMNVNVDWNGGNSEQSVSKAVAFSSSKADSTENNQKTGLLRSRLDAFRAKAESSIKQVVDSSRPAMEDYNNNEESELRSAEQVSKPVKAKSKKNR